MKLSGEISGPDRLIPAVIRAGGSMLTPVTADDCAWLEALRLNGEVKEILGPESENWAAAAEENVSGDAMHFIIRNSDSARVGYIGAYPDGDSYPSMPRWHIYFAIEPEARRKGHATEALNGLTEFLLRKFAYPRVVADIAMTNTAALRVVEKCGYVKPPSRLAHVDFRRVLQGARFSWYRLQTGRRALLAAKGMQCYGINRFTDAIHLWHQSLGYRYDESTPYTDLWISSNLGMAYSSARLYVQARQWLERAEVLADIQGVAHSYISRELAWIDSLTGYKN